ncbi:MAG: hypothetical protein ACFWUC_07440 [Oscillospiraceae bacterium]|jgi:hypothetical protein
MIKNLLIGFAGVFLYKLLSNIVNYFEMRYYINRHVAFLANGDATFITCQHAIKKLVKRANITATSIPVVQPQGYGQLASFTADCLDNIDNRRADIALCLRESMLKAEGTFKSRIFECFSPRYWIELIIFLPKNFVEYIGLDGEKWPAKVLNVIWWLLAPIAIVWRNQLYSWLTGIINQIY